MAKTLFPDAVEPQNRHPNLKRKGAKADHMTNSTASVGAVDWLLRGEGDRFSVIREQPPRVAPPRKSGPMTKNWYCA